MVRLTTLLGLGVIAGIFVAAGGPARVRPALAEAQIIRNDLRGLAGKIRNRHPKDADGGKAPRLEPEPATARPPPANVVVTRKTRGDAKHG